MSQASALLDKQLEGLGRTVLQGGGNVRMADAKRHAEQVYDKFKAEKKRLRHEAADEAINSIKNAAKSLPRTPRKSS